MTKFNSDYAIFGTLAADLDEDTNIGDAIINYTNKACIDLYGDLQGKTIFEILSAISNNDKEGHTLVDTLKSAGMLSFEGKLNGKFVKYHTRIVEPHDTGCDSSSRFIQAGITDITESIILKQLLYGSSEALKRAAKAADEDTGKHVVRINRYSELLAILKGCEDKSIEDIAQFAQLHDIGKINVAEIIRLPRKLTNIEFSIVKKHTIYGGEMVAGLAGLEMAFNIALEHHEKYDGSGYPHGKKKEDISFEARIVAITDVFDALVSARPYKEPFDYKKTFHIFKYGDGRVMPSHFDPELLDLFLDQYEGFVELHKELKD